MFWVRKIKITIEKVIYIRQILILKFYKNVQARKLLI